MSKKTIRIDEDLHKMIQLIKAELEYSSLNEVHRDLLIKGVEDMKEELPEYLKKRMEELLESA